MRSCWDAAPVIPRGSGWGRTSLNPLYGPEKCPACFGGGGWVALVRMKKPEADTAPGLLGRCLMAEVQLLTPFYGVTFSPGPAALPSHPLPQGLLADLGFGPQNSTFGCHPGVHKHTDCPGVLLVVPEDQASTPCTLPPPPQHNSPGNFLSLQPCQGTGFPWNQSSNTRKHKIAEGCGK